MINRKKFDELSIAEQDKIIKNLLSNIKRKIKKLETKNLLKCSRAYWLMLQNTKRYLDKYLDKYRIYVLIYNFNISSTSRVSGIGKEIIYILNRCDIEIKNIPELIKTSIIFDDAFAKTEFNYYETESDFTVESKKKNENEKMNYEELKKRLFIKDNNLFNHLFNDKSFNYNKNLSGYENLTKKIIKALRKFKINSSLEEYFLKEKQEVEFKGECNGKN